MIEPPPTIHDSRFTDHRCRPRLLFEFPVVYATKGRGRWRWLPDDPQVVKEPIGVYVSRMRVTVNGEHRDLRDGLTVAELVDTLGLRARRIAVEINLDVLA